MNRPEALARNLHELQEELRGSRAQLLVVSKTQTTDDIRSLYQAGQRHFGENRVQELLEKAEALRDLTDLRWHLIGPLQSNKINKLKSLERLVAIHSVASLELTQKLVEALSGRTQHLGIFLQVNTSGEAEKSGFETPDELLRAAEFLAATTGPVVLQGLMTMGTIRTEDVEGEAHRCFKQLVNLRDQLMAQLKVPQLELSMGM
ncbi:MAG: YggS family pyridoxal phosphate-dependent enzyme, partial [Bacteriovoracia bacterium]